MGLFEGKRGLIMGVANDRSIAWSIAQEVMNQGGHCGFTHLPDRADDDKQRNRARVEKCTSTHANAKFLTPMDVQRELETGHDRHQPRRICVGDGCQCVQFDRHLQSLATADESEGGDLLHDLSRWREVCSWV